MRLARQFQIPPAFGVVGAEFPRADISMGCGMLAASQRDSVQLSMGIRAPLGVYGASAAVFDREPNLAIGLVLQLACL